MRTEDQPPIIDFTNLDNNTPDVRSRIISVDLAHDLREICPLFGEIDTDQRRTTAYIYADIEGMIFIPNPFTEMAQRQLIHHCLHKYTQPPNLSNLDAHYDIPSDGVWNLYTKDCDRTDKVRAEGRVIRRNSESPKRQKTLSVSDGDKETSTKKPTENHTSPSMTKNEDDQTFKGSSDEKTSSSTSTPTELVKKLRWVTLGYQYNWTSKVYDFDNLVAFPNEAGDLSIAVAKAVEGIGYYKDGVFQWQNIYKGDSFVPEAGIVNYYQLKDTLMAHVDRSEINMAAPLVSISLGHDCIYLIGGPTRDTTPHAIRLQSGDVMVMTGAGRSAYHGVPKVLESVPSFLRPDIHDESIPDWKVYGEYISKARINLNIRQVHNNSPS